MLIADNPSTEAGLEGGTQFADNLVQLMEDSVTPGSNAVWQNMQADPALLSDAFPKVNMSANGIELGSMNPPAGAMEFKVSDIAGAMPDLGQQFSSLIQTALQLPGPLGFLGAIFQFFSALFTSIINTALNPNLLAQLAQGAIDLKKMIMVGQGI
jgi:hypothetical protein